MATTELTAASEAPADAPAEVATVQTTTTAATTQTSVSVGQAPPVDKVDHPVAAPTAGTTDEYPGTWAGLCQRLDDCGCNPMASVTACASSAEPAYTEGLALARSLGTPPAMLATMEMTPERLYMAANSQCSAVCSEVSALTGSGGVPANKPSGTRGNGIRIDASASPNGGSIVIEEDGW